MVVKSKAPAKIILSGEHSIVYGTPAIAFAIEKFTQTTINKTNNTYVKVSLFFEETKAKNNISIKKNLTNIYSTYKHINQKYRRYINNIISINALLDENSDLFFYAISHIAQKYNLKITPMEINIYFNFPISSGLGSSSSSTASLVKAFLAFHDLQISAKQLQKEVAYIERIQHGCISKIDSAACVFGGMIKILDDKIYQKPIKLDQSWYLVNTSIPSTTTGECVAAVKDKFASSEIWNEFKEVIADIETTLINNDHKLIDHIKRNHFLLVELGVVPKKIQTFIGQINQCPNCAAKITGAGSIHGDNGGFVLVKGDSNATLIMDEFNYQWQHLNINNQGTKIIAHSN